jgi:hypothetical protein
MAVSFSGSLDISGSLTTTGTIVMSGSIASASFATNATTASNANTSSYVVSSVTDTSQNTRLVTIEAVTGSYASTSSFGSYTASNDTTNTTQNARIASNEAKTGSFATTGSNYFIGTQVITGSVYIANDLIVQGSSSLQNITASAVSVGTNTIILNTNTPILQFGGIAVFDSGSTQGRSGSLLWNSINDHWLNVNPSGSDEGYNSAMVINGPKNTGSLGNEVGLTTNYIPVSQGEDHITDSIIFQSGSTNIGIGTTNPRTRLQVTPQSNGEVPTLGTANGIAIFTSANSNYGLQFSSTSDGSFQIQSQRFDNVSTAYNIGLNPVGGNVGIGTNNPSTALHIQASVPTIRLTNSSAGAGAGSIQFYSGSTQIWNLGTHTNNDMYLYNNTTSTYNYWVQNSSGNIGIGGTTSPSSLLEINRSSNSGAGSTFPRINVVNSLATQGDGSSTYNFADLRLAAGNSAVEVYLTATYAAGTWEPQGILNVGTNHPLSFKTNNTERMRILSGGNIGIGTTNPGYKLDISGTSTTALRLIDSGDVGFQMMSGGTNNAFSIRTNGSTVIMSTSNSYPITIGVNSSTNGVLGSTTGLSIASGGAATFASNVSVGGVITLPGSIHTSAQINFKNVGSETELFKLPLSNNTITKYGATDKLYYKTDKAVSNQNILAMNSDGEVLMGTTTTNSAGKLQVAGNIVPEANGTRDLGSASYRWSTIYTSDLSLSNGIGDYTIVEGENDLFLYNNKQNKVYKFMLAEVDPADATPKKS